MKSKFVVGILFLNILFGLFFSLYKKDSVPQCLNADEVAFGYNAYSMLKTGRDEYGRFMPLRMESFKDYKLPVYSLLSTPIMALFGYNDITTRALNTIVGLLYIPVIYLLVKEWWNDERVALLASFFGAVTPGLYILTRHAHEGPLVPLFLLISMLLIAKYQKNSKRMYIICANIALVFAAYSYHYGRIFLLFFIAYQIFVFVTSSKLRIKISYLFLGGILLSTIFVSFYPDFVYGANRVANLVFYKDAGFQLRLNEYLNEHPNRIVHNKLTEAVRDISYRYIAQISPEFLVLDGDKNWRFGMPRMGPVTIVELVFFFIGLYYLFKQDEKYRYLLLLLLLVTPVSNALTWQGPSLIRAYFIFFPMLIITSYGLVHFFEQIRNNLVRLTVVLIAISAYGYFLYFNWDLYFNHYSKRAMTVRAWQCGYKELVTYVDENYNNFERFYITDRHGQPYIYFLHYLKFDPEKYQAQAKISGPDGYGFGQVEKFDKFRFKFNNDIAERNSMFVGYPDEIKGLGISQDDVKIIKVGSEEIFYIYENK